MEQNDNFKLSSFSIQQVTLKTIETESNLFYLLSKVTNYHLSATSEMIEKL